MKYPDIRSVFFIACFTGLIAGMINNGAFAAPHSQADTMFKEADSADISQNYKDAQAKYLALIKTIKQTDPKNPLILRAQVRLARIYILQKQFDSAEPIFVTIVHTDPKATTIDPELMIDLDDLSDEYINLGSDPHYGYESLKHCAYLRQYINPSHPHLPEIDRLLAQTCCRFGSKKEAIEWMTKGIDVEKHFSLQRQGLLLVDQNYLASIYLALENYASAEKLLKEAIDNGDKRARGTAIVAHLHTTLGEVYTKTKRYDEADKEYKTSLSALHLQNKIDQALKSATVQAMQINDQLRRKNKKNRHLTVP